MRYEIYEEKSSNSNQTSQSLFKEIFEGSRHISEVVQSKTVSKKYELRKSELHLKEALSVCMGQAMREITEIYDFSYYDFIIDEDFGSSKYMTENINSVISKFRFQCSQLKSSRFANETYLNFSIRLNIEHLFDEYEDGYLLPFYTMLHLETGLMNCEDFYRYLNNLNFPLEYCEKNGIALISKVPDENLKRMVRDIQFANLTQGLRQASRSHMGK